MSSPLPLVISSTTLSQPPSYPKEHVLHIDRDKNVYGVVWYKWNEFIHKLETVTKLYNQCFHFQGFMYHRIHGYGSSYLNIDALIRQDDGDRIYPFLDLFTGIGYYVIYSLSFIQHKALKCNDLTLWSIIQHPDACTHFIQLIDLVWHSSRVDAGLETIARDEIHERERSKQIVFDWFTLHRVNILNYIDGRQYPTHGITQTMKQAAQHPDPNDHQYITTLETERNKQSRQRKYRKKILFQWIMEACFIRKRYDPLYQLIWPFPPSTVMKQEDEKKDKQEKKEKKEDTVSLQLPIWIDDEDEDKVKAQVQETNKGTYVTGIGPSPEKTTPVLYDMSIQEMYSIDITSQERSDFRNEYELCLSQILILSGRDKVLTSQDIETGLLLHQTIQTQVFFVHYVALIHNKKKSEHGQSGVCKLVRNSIEQLIAGCMDYMRHQTWVI